MLQINNIYFQYVFHLMFMISISSALDDEEEEHNHAPETRIDHSYDISLPREICQKDKLLKPLSFVISHSAVSQLFHEQNFKTSKIQIGTLSHLC